MMILVVAGARPRSMVGVGIGVMRRGRTADLCPAQVLCICTLSPTLATIRDYKEHEERRVSRGRP